nr:MAG TPA: hypothetical protein [Caudoviricetes sp.]
MLLVRKITTLCKRCRADTAEIYRTLGWKQQGYLPHHSSHYRKVGGLD